MRLEKPSLRKRTRLRPTFWTSSQALVTTEAEGESMEDEVCWTEAVQTWESRAHFMGTKKGRGSSKGGLSVVDETCSSEKWKASGLVERCCRWMARQLLRLPSRNRRSPVTGLLFESTWVVLT